MVQEGQVVLFKFPYTDQMEGKLRPALVIRKVPGPHDDWLSCMISSQLSQGIDGFDEFLSWKNVVCHCPIYQELLSRGRAYVARPGLGPATK